MKIIHTADVHLDSSLKTHLPSDVAKERRKELFDAFKKVVKFASDNDIKVIIIAGDLFDAKVTKRTREDLMRLIEKNPDIDFIYPLGNHDEDSLNFDEIEKPGNLFICNDTWEVKEYDDVTINYINFNSNSEKHLYDTLNLDSSKKNIVVLHGQVTESNENGMIQLKKLRNKNINYLALGHIHQNSINKLDDNSVYVYCGCLEGRGFDEEGKKGFYVIDTDDINNPKFIVNSKREVHKIDVSIDKFTSWLDFEDEVENMVSSFDSNDMVEVNIEGKYSVDLVKDVEKLEKYLNDKFYFGKVKDQSKLEINPADYENSPTFKSQFIKLVMSSSDYNDEEKKQIIEIGIHAMMGDEI